jgi:signal transduction histidine kinase
MGANGFVPPEAGPVSSGSGRFRLWPAGVPRRLLTLADVVTALGLGAAMAPGVQAAGTHAGRWVAGLSVAVLCLAIAGRRRWPVAAVLAGTAAVSVDAAGGRGALVSHAALPAMIACVLLFYGAGAFARPPAALAGLVAGIALLLPQIFLTPDSVSDLFFEPVILGLAPWGAGRLLSEFAERERAQREYAALVEAQLEQQARLAARRQATEMARELHDDLGHRLSVIVLQASGARLMLKSAPDRSMAALGVIEEGCREALAELRRLAGAAGQHPGRILVPGPQPGIGDIEALTSQLPAIGLAVTCEAEGAPRPVAPGLGLSAYRIVQEALTNTIKHAQATEVAVRIAWQPGELVVRIADNGRGARAAARISGTGQGIIGMRERAALHQGTLTAAPAERGYVVQARFPLTGCTS